MSKGRVDTQLTVSVGCVSLTLDPEGQRMMRSFYPFPAGCGCEPRLTIRSEGIDRHYECQLSLRTLGADEGKPQYNTMFWRLRDSGGRSRFLPDDIWDSDTGQTGEPLLVLFEFARQINNDLARGRYDK